MINPPGSGGLPETIQHFLPGGRRQVNDGHPPGLRDERGAVGAKVPAQLMLQVVPVSLIITSISNDHFMEKS